MASSDVRDILDVGPSSEPRPKKQKLTAQQKNAQFAGMSKEVRGLMIGDSIAPVHVQEHRYKSKPRMNRRPAPWHQDQFTNPARKDGLVLKHWIRGLAIRPENSTAGTPAATVPGAPVTPAESKSEEDGSKAEKDKPRPVQTDYYFAKFNTKASVPEYTDEQYESNLKNQNWSKEETDYLIEMAKDFDLRWVVIWDRYDFQSKPAGEGEDSMAVTVPSKSRSMEELKARYYEVSAKMMAIHHPLSSMSTAEFDLHEKMLKFDPNRETMRKRLAESLLNRSPDDIREEEILLGELKRIVDNEDRFLEERKELYNRLNHPPSRGSISLYETSAGLTQLMQQLIASDKNKKRRSITGPGDTTASPAQSHPPHSASTVGRGEARGAGANKKGSAAAHPQQRELTPRDKIRFGVSNHDRLVSGVSFRHSRIEKLVLAKSAAQAQKLHDALAELGIPVRAVMPTNRVCAEYEKLIHNIHLLLDTRKHSEKINNEIRVLTTQKETRERKERGEDDTAPAGDKDQDGTKTGQGDGSSGEAAADQLKGEEAKDDDEDDKEDGKDEENEEDAEDGEKDGDDQDAEDGEGEGEDAEAEGASDAEANNEADEDQEDANAEAEEDLEEHEQEAQDDENMDEAGDVEEVEEEGGEEVREELEEDVQSRGSRTASLKNALSHKRSASVLSAASEKSSKRTRK